MARRKRLVTLSVFLLVVTGITSFHLLAADDAAPAQPESHAPRTVPADDDYGLKDGEFVKCLMPPFPDSRSNIYEAFGYKPSPGQTLIAPTAMIISFENGKLTRGGMAYGTSWNAGQVIGRILSEQVKDVEGDTSLLKLEVPGDFVYRADAAPERLMGDLQKVFETSGNRISLVYRNVKKTAIVFKGEWTGTIPNADKKYLEIYGRDLDPYPEADVTREGNMASLARALTLWVRRPVVMEPTGGPPTVGWHFNTADGAPEDGYKHAHEMKLVLDHIKEQTGLTWTEEEREVPRLFVESLPADQNATTEPAK